MKRRTLSVIVLTLCCLLLAAVSPAAAQINNPSVQPTETEPLRLDPTAESAFGSWYFGEGLILDPTVFALLGGGIISVSNEFEGPGCVGYVNDIPDFVINWFVEDTDLLRFYLLSEVDMTLLIMSPSGDFYCSDDYEGSNPLIEFAAPELGDYVIWLGTYNRDLVTGAYLFLSTQQSSPHALNSPLLLSTQGQGAQGTQPTAVSLPTAVPTEAISQQLLLLQEALADVDGVEFYPGLTVFHEQGTLTYPQTPPVGGNHNPVWLNCGIYDAPVTNENAVHSLEHGAIWMTYDPSLPNDQVEYLRAIARQSGYLIVSPYPGLPSPVAVTAWGVQLYLPDAFDARLIDFINQLLETPSGPELAGLCSGGVGSPIETAG